MQGDGLPNLGFLQPVATLTKAPLVEVVTQFRWGSASRDDAGELVAYVFSDHEKENLFSALERVIIDAGFVVVDRFAKEVEDVEFTPARAYRREPGGWPAIQLGLGMLSVHQDNDGYDWPDYKSEVLAGLDLLTEALGAFYGQPPFIGVELAYMDAFILGESETPYEFLTKNLAVKLVPPRPFFAAPFVSNEPASASLGFDFALSEPNGVLRLSLEYEEVFGGPGYTMDTRVLSLNPSVGFTRAGMEDWLEAAHRVHQHTFRTLIEPAYLKSLQ
jgi:uncharacterized protein (TIGR04255 family)